MKLLSLLFILMGLNAHAIQTKNCPLEIELTLGDFTQASEIPKGALYAKDTGAVKASYNFMPYMKEFTSTLFLDDTQFSRCRYESAGNETAILSGSTKPGAKKSARLTVYWSRTLNGGVIASYGASFPLTAVSTEELTLRYPNGYANVFHLAEACNWGECGPAFEDMGRAYKAELVVR